MVDRRIGRERAARPALLSMSKWLVNDEVEKGTDREWTYTKLRISNFGQWSILCKTGQTNVRQQILGR